MQHPKIFLNINNHIFPRFIRDLLMETLSSFDSQNSNIGKKSNFLAYETGIKLSGIYFVSPLWRKHLF